ncbi:MAG: hydroxysqualene dehydroxylase HpnE [Nocardioides sp.]|uniref:hydroxysqualene dehydroxylase HpnE n=1 Tax=Nocardioides sp. TaxID=35761 RepID=UPI0039E6A61B
MAVVGGGLAGITAALRLADAGWQVSLHEAKPKLGGLTHSFRRDSADGTVGPLWVDNGQHVFLRCCTSYLGLLDRLGVRDQVALQDRLDVPVRSGVRAGVSRLRRNTLPAPLHLGAALAGYRWLPLLDRGRIVPAALALGRVDRERAEVDELSFGDWLREHGQSPRAIETVWDLIGVATLNAHADEASLALAATVFQLGLLEACDAADIGWSKVPLQQLHGDAAARALDAAGVEVRVGSKVADLDDLTTDRVVVATTAADTARLVPDLDLPEGYADSLGAAPIINLHLIFDRPVLDEPFVAAVDSPLQWVFDRTGHAGLAHGQYLAVSLSAADALVDVPVRELEARFLPEVLALLPAARDAELRDFFVTRERRATFRPAPGSGRFRAETRTKDPRICLAGAWTATGWPATMEGACRSGEAAAAALTEERMDLVEVGA